MARQFRPALLRSGYVSIFVATAALALFSSRDAVSAGAHRPVISAIQPIQSASLALKRQQAAELLGRLPLRFEPGAPGSESKFMAKGPGYDVGLSKNRIVVASQASGKEGAAPLEVELVNARPSARMSGSGQLPGTSNYYIGNDAAQWRTGVPQFERVGYKDLYDGIDAVFYGTPRQLEFDFVVAPQADPSAIRLQLSGGASLEQDSAGNLIAKIGADEVQLQRPVIYQEISGERRLVAGAFAIHGSSVGFRIGEYDHTLPLVIDPILQYASYLGGSGIDTIQAVEVAANGDVIVAGYTTSTNFPIVNGALSNNRGSGDGFIARLNSLGNTILYSTYLGGALDDQLTGIAIDGAGSIWVTGFSNSSNFPLQTQLQTVIAGGYDAVVARFSTAGLLQFSTYAGGNSDDFGKAIAVDSASAVYVTGGTLSTNFPTGIAAQVNYGGASAPCPTTGTGLGLTGDAFVFKLNSSGATLQYSTYLGGSGCDVGNGIAVDINGNAYVTGATTSPNFPTAGAIQNNLGGGTCTPFGGGSSYTCPDAFVTKLNSGGAAILYSTYLGGNSLDVGSGIAVDSTGAAYIVGTTESSNFPVANALKSTRGGTQDAFVTKVKADGSALTYSTYFGGSGTDYGNAIKLDPAKRAYITGDTLSGDLPMAKQIQDHLAGSLDAFVATLSASGAVADYSTYYGSTGEDHGLGLAVDASGNIWVGGYTQSSVFPTRAPVQAASGGSLDAILFMTDLVPGGPAVNAGGIINNASYAFSPAVAPGSIAAVFGSNLNDGSTVLAPFIDPQTNKLSTTLGGTSVAVNNLAAPIYYSTPGQIGIQIPFDLAPGTTTIQVIVAGQQSAPQTVTISNTAPGLFTLNQQGSGLPAALHQDGVTPVSFANPAHYNEVIDFYGTGLGQTSPPLATGQFSGANLANGQTLATVGGTSAVVEYSGTAPGFVGLNQINVRIPSGISTGAAIPVVISVGGVPANTVMLPVAP